MPSINCCHNIICKKKAVLLCCFFAFLFFMSCEREYYSPIPNAPVSIRLDLYFAQQLMNTVTADTIIKEQPIGMRQGFGGVLIVHGYGDGNPPLFAYDLACPNEVDRNICVVSDKAGRAVCPKCGSVFVTLWGTGSPEGKSVTKYPLKTYRVITKENSTECWITN